jgi:ornithine cyclodeaminase/alanine dehydrogenase-like protein (mu-crystallin family)
MATNDLPFFDADAIRRAVPIADLLDAVDGAYRDVASGRDRSPLRSHVPLGDGALLMMPGVREGGSGATVKLVTVKPGNPARGLPTIHAVVVWFDAETGSPVALMDGATITAMRTGAASGVATRLLARTDAATLAVIGTGAQAAWQVRAVLAARPIRRVLVYSRDAARRATFASTMADEVGLPVEAAPDANAAVREADIVCCATTSSDPVFDAGSVRPGTHLNGIGAFRLDMVELPPELFGRASLVAIDARQASLSEAGDVAEAIRRGIIGEDDLVEIGSVAPTFRDGRDPTAITVFKSVGLAIQDVAAAGLVARRLMAGS